MKHYILAKDEKTPVPVSLSRWAKWRETADRRVAYYSSGFHRGGIPVDRWDSGISVSTVFLGLDHNLDDKGEPILFETMVFGGPHDGYTKRYSTFVEAINGHEHTISKVLNEEEWGD